MKALRLLLFCFIALYSKNAVAQMRPDLNVVHEWKYIDYDFGNEKDRQAAIDSGDYNYENCYPIDVDRWNGVTFVTVIRDQGVPATLNTISNKTGKGGPLLAPYPNWSWNDPSSCDNIISVYRVAVDRCDRLWVLDTGVNGEDRVCPAKLLTFDLHTSKLLKRITIPDEVAINSTSGQGLLITPIVQTFGPSCERTNVYMADVEGYAIIFYNGASFRRITSSALVFDPEVTTYTIEGESFTLVDGPLGMALSPISQNLYLSPMSSHNLVALSTWSLTNPRNSNVQFREAKDILWTQTSAKAMSSTGTLFFGLVSDTAIGCWNEFRPLHRSNIDVVAVNAETLQFTSGMKIKRCGGIEELWAMTNRYQKIASGSLDFDEINFRILKGNVNSLIWNTSCRPRRRPYY